MKLSPLTQPLHIFRKDVIHLWPETLVSMALLAGYAWADVQTWTPDDSFNPATLGKGILAFLVVISWLILISRLVHDEELVGDRQFWTTRPYTWYGLLSAKLLYIAVFICVPFVIMQVWLLHHAGLYPTQLVPAILKNLLSVSLIFLLPLFAIAAVTATFVRYISSVLVGFIYLFVVVAVLGFNAPESLSAPYIGYIVSVTILLLVLASVLLQYSLRRTLVARLLLVAVPASLVVFAAITPVNLLNDHRYPQTAAGTLTFDSDPMLQQPEGRIFIFEHKVLINVPVQVQLKGIDDNSTVAVQRVRVDITGPNGFHYTSNWSSENAQFTTQRPRAMVPFRLPESVWNSIHSQPVAIHLQLGTQIFAAGTPYSVNATETPFPGPSHAACTVDAEGGTVDCRFPFGNPTFTRVSATVHDGNCLVPGQRSATASTAIRPTVSPFAFSPIEIVRSGLSLGTSNIPLCPDTRTTFIPAVPGSYGRMTADIPTITLDPYAYRIPVRPEGAPPIAGSRQ